MNLSFASWNFLIHASFPEYNDFFFSVKDFVRYNVWTKENSLNFFDEHWKENFDNPYTLDCKNVDT